MDGGRIRSMTFALSVIHLLIVFSLSLNGRSAARSPTSFVADYSHCHSGLEVTLLSVKAPFRLR
jgi:hypothetical protein